MSIGNWEPPTQLTAAAPKASEGLAAEQHSPSNLSSLPPTSATVASKSDKSSEHHDSGIDISNDRDTGSMRSSPDAASLSVLRSSTHQAPPSFGLHPRSPVSQVSVPTATNWVTAATLV